MTGEGNRTSYVRQNGRTYAYVYRSGIDGPRTEYLGKVDESSGDVMIPCRRLPAPRRKEGAVMSMELGNVLILDSVAESSGLKDDLKGTFGDRWIWILALAMAQAIRPTVMRGSMDTVNRTCITDILDLEYPSDGRIPISCSTTHAELTRFYTSRHKRSGTFSMLCMHMPNRSPSYIRADRYDETPLWSSDEYNALISISSTGEPIGMMILSGTPREVTSTTGFIRSLVSEYGRFPLILEQKFTDAGRMPLFLKTGADVVTMTSTIVDPVVPMIDSMFMEGTGKKVMGPDGRRFMFNEGSVGVMKSNHYTSYISKDDDRYGLCEHHINMFPTVDLDINRIKNAALTRRLSEVIGELDGTFQDNPVASFNSTAREVARYLKMSVNDDGVMNVTTRDDVVERDRKLFGLTMVISSSGDWYESVSLLSSSSNIMSYLGVHADDPNHDRKDALSGEQMFNRMVRMVSAVMLSRIRRTLNENGYEMDPRDALRIASSYMLIDTGEEVFTTDPDRSALRIMRLFENDP